MVLCTQLSKILTPFRLHSFQERPEWNQEGREERRGETFLEAKKSPGFFWRACHSKEEAAVSARMHAQRNKVWKQLCCGGRVVVLMHHEKAHHFEESAHGREERRMC